MALTSYAVQECVYISIQPVIRITCSDADHVTTDATGSFSTKYVVQRVVNGVECRLVENLVSSGSWGDFTDVHRVGIIFVDDTNRPAC